MGAALADGESLLLISTTQLLASKGPGRLRPGLLFVLIVGDLQSNFTKKTRN
jgi:hypothetical protein